MEEHYPAINIMKAEDRAPDGRVISLFTFDFTLCGAGLGKLLESYNTW